MTRPKRWPKGSLDYPKPLDPARESTLALLALSMLVLVVLVFALDAARVRSVDAAAGALWVAMV